MRLDPIPVDDPTRRLTVSKLDAPELRHISVAGDIYTVLVAGSDTAMRYCLIDMLVPDSGGPPPHRHDFEEMFTLLEGELEFTFCGKTQKVEAPVKVNNPATAPHQFKNLSGRTAHMFCMCTPAGLDEFFLSVGVPVPSRDSQPPHLTPGKQAAKGELAAQLAPKFRTELLIMR